MNGDFLEKLVDEQSMIVCCGSGGVGKTTTSAVIALEAARRGRTVLVLTIDPAKRLANSLGIPELGNTVAPIDPAHLARSGLEIRGSLSAMMLDCKRTFDHLIEQYAPSPEVAQSILANRYYQHLSNAMTGSHEYMAMEKLYEIHRTKQFDLVVLDTPPTQNALDFLEAPNRMTDVLDESVLKWLIKPYFVAGKISSQALKTGGKVVFHLLERVTGIQVLQDISDFVMAFSGMFDGFKQRAQAVRELLRSPRASFVLITGPNAITVDECVAFARRLKEYQMPFGGVIVNKVHVDVGISPASAQELLNSLGLTDLGPLKQSAERLAEIFCEEQILAGLDRQSILRLQRDAQLAAEKIRAVRYFDQDIADIPQLRAMLSKLFPNADRQSVSADEPRARAERS